MIVESLGPILHDLRIAFEALADLLARLKEIEREIIELSGTFEARSKLRSAPEGGK
jgi:hypothetical protein